MKENFSADTITTYSERSTRSRRNSVTSVDVDENILEVSCVGNSFQEEKIRYKCQNIFTIRPNWIQDTKLSYGFIHCPSDSCQVKLGIFSYEGIRCQTCLQNI